MVSFLGFKSKKNGFLALDALIGIVLSTIAMVLLVNVLIGTFLSVPENLDIAKQNAKSISNFLEFSSSGDYANLKDCYNVLKLSNLENFQYEDNDDNYFYVIDSKGVYVVSEKYLDGFKKIGSLNGIKSKPDFAFKDIKNFGDNVELIFDDTEEGTIWQAFGSGSYDSILRLDRKIKYILMQPAFKSFESQNVFLKEVLTYGDYSEEQRNDFDLESQTVTTNLISQNWESASGTYLVYNREKNILFVSKSEHSDFLVTEKICSTKQLFKDVTYEDYKKMKPKDIDYVNNHVFLALRGDNKKIYDIKFEWKNGPICKNEEVVINCRDILKISGGVTYREFCDLIWDFYKEKYHSLDEIDFFVENVVPLSFLDVKTYDNIRFEDIFKKLDGVDISNLDKYIEDKDLDNFAYNMANWWPGGDLSFNGLKNEVSNTIFYENGIAYFYIDKSYSGLESGYYRFREDFLRKKNSETLIFNKKEIRVDESKIIETDDRNRYGDDNRNFYKFIIGNEGLGGVISICSDVCLGKSYEVIISSRQFNEILDEK